MKIIILVGLVAFAYWCVADSWDNILKLCGLKEDK